MLHVMITGANRGLGYELLKIFHQEGHQLYPVVRSAAGMEMLQNQFEDRIYPIQADVSMEESKEMVQSVLSQKTNKLDILINNAGVVGQREKIDDLTTEEVSHLFNVHCLGVIRMVKTTLPYLAAADAAKVVNVSSRLGSIQMTANGAFDHLGISYGYHIAKAAQNMLSVCLHQELAYQNISVFAIHPGELKTEMAATDANLEVSEGAGKIYDWLLDQPQNKSIQFIQPGSKELKW